VDVPALKAGLVEERAFQVVATDSRAEEPVAHQVARADLDLEPRAHLHDKGGLTDQQRRVVGRLADLAELGGDAALALLETGVRLQVAAATIPRENLQPVVSAIGPTRAGVGIGNLGDAHDAPEGHEDAHRRDDSAVDTPSRGGAAIRGGAAVAGP
jgi:hypothetical protein